MAVESQGSRGGLQVRVPFGGRCLRRVAILSTWQPIHFAVMGQQNVDPPVRGLGPDLPTASAPAGKAW